MIIAKSQFFSVPFDRKYIIRREICNFPPQKSKILPQNHRKKFENWKLKIHVKFTGVFTEKLDLRQKFENLLLFSLQIFKKGEGSELPPSLLSLATPLESSFLIGRDVSTLLLSYWSKNDVHEKSKAKHRKLRVCFGILVHIIFWTNRKTEALKYCVLIGPPPTHAPFKMIGR